jgi:hypothetical protein
VLTAIVQHSEGWESRWVKSNWKKSEGKAGTFRHTAGTYSGDPDDKGEVLFKLIQLNMSINLFWVIDKRRRYRCPSFTQ